MLAFLFRLLFEKFRDIVKSHIVTIEIESLKMYKLAKSCVLVFLIGKHRVSYYPSKPFDLFFISIFGRESSTSQKIDLGRKWIAYYGDPYVLHKTYHAQINIAIVQFDIDLLVNGRFDICRIVLADLTHI
jgi:predicted solute-binding protein